MARPRSKKPAPYYDDREENRLPEREDETFDRTPRLAEERHNIARPHSIRPALNFGKLGRFNIDPIIQARFPHHVLAWVVYTRANEEERENYEYAIERGYIPVMKEEIAEYNRSAYMSPFDREQKGNDQLIRRGGQIMMKRLKEDHEAESNYWANEHLRQQDTRALFEVEGFRPSFHDMRKQKVAEGQIHRPYY
jgi:hypothetical protein